MPMWKMWPAGVFRAGHVEWDYVAAYRVELVKVGKPRADAIEDDETAPGLERPTALTAEERARMVAYADQAMIELIRAGEAPEQVPDLAWLMAGQMIRNGRAMT